MNSVSEPPVNISNKGSDRITFADVAMRVARDGPMYGVILLVGILAISGKATANETIMGSALALLARSWPGAIQTGGAGRNMGIVAVLTFGSMALSHLVGCGR
jgi:hypothetical protein